MWNKDKLCDKINLKSDINTDYKDAIEGTTRKKKSTVKMAKAKQRRWRLQKQYKADEDCKNDAKKMKMKDSGGKSESEEEVGFSKHEKEYKDERGKAVSIFIQKDNAKVPTVVVGQ